MYDAEKLAGDPTPELKALFSDLKRVSEASESESRYDHECEDGSVLIATSRQGGDVKLETVPPPELV